MFDNLNFQWNGDGRKKMSYSFNLSKTTLLSLHMQHDIVSPDGKFADFFAEQAKERHVVQMGNKLLTTARSHNIPIIHVAVCFEPDHSDLHPNAPLLSMVHQTNALVKGTYGADFIEEVKPLDYELVVKHQRVGPFQNTNLSELLKENGTENVVLFGVATNIVVETTARIASDEGYNVFVVEDCCSAATMEAHKATLQSLSLLTTITTLEEITQSFSFVTPSSN
ncbi:cysteine hydrolase family protein [Evansella sp. AB-rgal1]|uniref:cysteine hydrolase family protein n=1 Tax=Evansella sp. AB-rgal1 TaxID=3242696 RepID=UPI00359E8D2B